MKLGYARVSTKDQSLNLQVDALKKEGCERIFQEKVSGTKSDRVELTRLLDQVRKGDVIIIWKLDRLGRLLKDLVTIVSELMDREVGLKSLNDPIDTTTSQGRLVFNIFASLSLAEFERDVIRERTQAGLEAARARGRPKGLSSQAQKKAIAAEALYKEKKLSIQEILENLDISKATFYRYLRHRGVTLGSSTKKHKKSSS